MMDAPRQPLILFVPICSECGQRINGTVDFQYLPQYSNAKINCIDYSISPSKCPHCDAHFQQIIMPTSLPFDGY